MLRGLLGVDLSDYDLDGPLPTLPETQTSQSRRTMLIEMAQKENLTIRQLYTKLAAGKGHFEVVGSIEQVADQIEHWFKEYAADGFNVMPPLMPSGLEDFVDLVIPELQKRDLFRKFYAGNTLREHLGLSRPHCQFR